jgi:hypothetical protein
MAVTDGTSVTYTETSSPDLGTSTSNITFDVIITGGDIELVAQIAAGTWDVKVSARII